MSKLSPDGHGNISGKTSVQNVPSTGNLLRNRKDNKDISGNRLTTQQSGTTLSLDVAPAQSQARLKREPNELDDKDDDEVSSSQYAGFGLGFSLRRVRA